MVVNLFTNPDMVATDGEVVVWENLVTNTSGKDENGDLAWHVNTAASDIATVEPLEDGEVKVTMLRDRSGAVVPVVSIDFPRTEGSTYGGSIEVRGEGESVGARARGRVYAGRNVADFTHLEFGIEFQRYLIPSNGATALVSGSSSLNIYFGIESEGLKEGSVFYLRNPSVWEVPEGEAPLFFFDETFSPDPDLTPQARPGGGSQLVGQQVAGLAATNGVVVQSEQWAKSRGVSGRIINNTGDPVTVALDDASVFTRLWTYDGAKETLATLASPSVIPGPATLGESKWVDLITSTAQRYDGPLFSGSTPNSADDSGYGWGYEWVGAPDASASTREYTQVRDVAIMVVEDLDAPAVGITVEGLSSVEASRVAIYRQTPGKERTLVQGLGNVDVDGAGYWVDYLPPLGVPVTYVVEVLEGDPLEENSATITIPSKTAWLQDALNPLLAVEVACRPGNRDTLFFTAEAFTAFERPTNSDLVSIMGGRVPVGMTSRRQTPVGIPFNMVTTAAEASSMLREVLIEGTHLVLRVPPEISMLDPVTYLSDVQVSEEPGRQSFLGGHVIRWNMTGSQTRGPRIMAWTALWTYDDVAELYAGYTYTDLTDGRRYVQWQANPDDAQLAGFSTTSGGGAND